MGSARTEAAAYELLDEDYAVTVLSTAPGRRLEGRSARTEAAVYAVLDVDYAFVGTSPSRRREGNWTWTDVATCAWARSCAGSNGDCPRTPLSVPPSPLSPPSPDIPSSSHPLHPATPHAHSLTSLGMMMGQLPVKGQRSHGRCCPDVEQDSSSTKLHCLAAGTPSAHRHA